MALEITPDGFVVDTSPAETITTELDGIMSNLPGYDTVTQTMKNAALSQSLVPDYAGVWPGQLNYSPTYDVYWAAISLVGFLQAQPVLRQHSSEGTSFAMDAPSWGSLVAFYKSMSRIAGATEAPVIGTVAIPFTPHVKHVDMSGRTASGERTPYGDIDTDVS